MSVPDSAHPLDATAVAAAEALGHTVVWDPPALSSVHRWTCEVCGGAVLHAGKYPYGVASIRPCTPPKELNSA